MTKKQMPKKKSRKPRKKPYNQIAISINQTNGTTASRQPDNNMDNMISNNLKMYDIKELMTDRLKDSMRAYPRIAVEPPIQQPADANVAIAPNHTPIKNKTPRFSSSSDLYAVEAEQKSSSSSRYDSMYMPKSRLKSPDKVPDYLKQEYTDDKEKTSMNQLREEVLQSKYSDASFTT